MQQRADLSRSCPDVLAGSRTVGPWWACSGRQRSSTVALWTRLRPCSGPPRSEEHTSELQSLRHLVCRLLLEKKKNNNTYIYPTCISITCHPRLNVTSRH